MALVLLASERASDCLGCMGRSTCWVCQGLGTLVARNGERSPCTTCYGGRLCSVCQPVPHQRDADLHQGIFGGRASGP